MDNEFLDDQSDEIEVGFDDLVELIDRILTEIKTDDG